MSEIEIWKDVVGYEGYYRVSNLGRVKRVRYGNRHDKNKTLACWIDRGGYLNFKASVNKIRKGVSVHSAVANAFHGKIQPGYEINHKDGNKLNNRADNLEYLTHADNLLHAHRTGLHKNNGENCNLSILTNAQVKEIVELFNSGISRKELRQRFSIGRSGLSGILLKRQWVNVTKDLEVDLESQKNRGERHCLAKLNNSQVIDILNHKDTGLQIKQVAQKFNLYPQVVSHIWKGVTWNHITKIKKQELCQTAI